MAPIFEALNNLRRPFLPIELSEELFDELDLQCALLQRVLFDAMLHV